MKATLAYDGGDLATRTDPLLKVESYVYDGMDNLTQFTDRKGKIATYSHDALNRRTLAEYGRGKKGGNLTAPDASVSYIYDAGDRLQQITDTQGGTITRSYDGLDRLVQESGAQGTVNYAFDTAGRRTGLTVAGQPGVSYNYDSGNRLTQITQGIQTVGFTYDTAGRRTGLTLPGGISAVYSYDAAGQLTGIDYSQNGNALGNLSYAYDQVGQRVQTGGSLARTLLPQELASATFDAANRLTSWAGQAQTYDANGNLLSDGVRTYTWDSRNRLVALSGGASFKYDALNRRSQKTLAGSTTATLHDGINPVQELSGATPTANLLSGLGMDEVFTRTDSGGTRSLLADALGSTLALADSAGIQTQYTYAPYGETSQSGTASGNAFQYTGRENDGSGLYYYRARYYDAVKSRFVSGDPIGLAGGINLYSYAEGNPVSKIDPLGLMGSRGYIPGRSPGSTVSVFGCLIGCVSSPLDGSTGPQASMEPTLGGGFEICEKPKPRPNPNQCDKPKPKNCGIYDPNCDNQIQPPGIPVPTGIGFIVGASIKKDGRLCLRFGLFGEAPLVPSVELGDLDE